jgi:hypothetical protein
LPVTNTSGGGTTPTTTSNNTTSTNSSTIADKASELLAKVLSLKLVDMPKILVGFYATEFALTFLTVLLIGFFSWSKQLPSEFNKDSLGRIVRGLGFLMKFLPRFIILFNYVIGIILIVMIGQVGNG